MNTNKNNKEKNNEIKDSLENFLSDNQTNKNSECKEDICYVNDGKEIVERIDKKILTGDGRRLLI